MRLRRLDHPFPKAPSCPHPLDKSESCSAALDGRWVVDKTLWNRVEPVQIRERGRARRRRVAQRLRSWWSSATPRTRKPRQWPVSNGC